MTITIKTKCPICEQSVTAEGLVFGDKVTDFDVMETLCVCDWESADAKTMGNHIQDKLEQALAEQIRDEVRAERRAKRDAEKGIIRTERWRRNFREVDVKILLCICKQEVPLYSFTNTCGCGRDYNMSGSLLAPRSHWGEETGETVSDILNHNYESMQEVDY